MTDKKPKWQKEIESFKGIKSTFIIEGNINDIYPYYDEKDQLNYYNLDSLLIKLFKIEELTVETYLKLKKKQKMIRNWNIILYFVILF